MIIPKSRGFVGGAACVFPRVTPALPHPSRLTPSSAAPDSKRRRFLFTLGVGKRGRRGERGGLGFRGGRRDRGGARRSEDGYRETAHVRDYYRTAKL